MSSGQRTFRRPFAAWRYRREDGGTRPLGIPTVGDRVAQTVVKMVLEPMVEPKSCIFTITVTYSKGIKRRGEADNS